MTQRNKDHTDKHAGGPGSSHQGGSHGETTRSDPGPRDGAPTSSDRSRVSGGGGEQDKHHTHARETKR